MVIARLLNEVRAGQLSLRGFIEACVGLRIHPRNAVLLLTLAVSPGPNTGGEQRYGEEAPERETR